MAKRRRRRETRKSKRDSTDVKIEDRSLIDYVPDKDTGYPSSAAAADTPENLAMLGPAVRDFPDSLWIEPKDWKDAARENDRYKLWGEDVKNRFTNQNPTHECTCHALIQVGEVAWNQQRKGKGDPVLFSQISVYAEANPRQWGGAGCQQVLGIALRRGWLPEPIKGQDKKFKHTLHGTAGRGNDNNSSGAWVPVSQFPDGWQETAMKLRPIEVINPRSVEQMVCLLLHGRAIGVGRSGHSVPYNKVVWEGGNSSDPMKGIKAHYSDSYDVIRYDSMNMMRSAVGGSYCIWSMITPDDWEDPGELT